MLVALLNSAAMVFVAAVFLAQANARMGRSTRLAHRIGYALISGGAFGSALEWWWPALEAYHSEYFLTGGLFCLALAQVLGWNGAERRGETVTVRGSRLDVREFTR